MSAQDDLIRQILGSSNKSAWTGQGYGSAEKNAADMARILSSIGITDVKQLGKVDKYEPVEQIGSALNGQPVEASGSKFYVFDSLDTGDGTDYVRRELSPEEAKQVKPIYGVATGTDEYNQPTYRNVDVTNVKEKDGQLFGATGQTFGNKLTGQEVPNTYTERQTGDFFGGTYEGKGNTGYGVQFDAQGNPVFYTQGASSSDFNDFAPLLTLASFVPGLQPFAMAANAAIAAKQGNPLGVITNLAGMGNLAGISGMADVAKAARFASAVKSGDPLAMAFSGANLGGITNVGGIDLKDISKTIGGIKALQSGDPLTMMLYGIDAMSTPGGSSPTKSSSQLQAEDPLTPEEQAQLKENQYNNMIRRLQISPEEEEANTQRAIEELERTYGPSSATRSLTGGTQVDEADDFLKSIGINTIDRPSDSGLSNQDILNMINADNNRVLITTDKDKPAPADTPAYSPIDDYFKPTPKKLEKLEIVGNRDKTSTYSPIDDYFTPTPKTTDMGELVITGKQDTCPIGTKLNPVTGECDPYWDEGGGDDTTPTAPIDPTSKAPATPKTPATKPSAAKPTTQGKAPFSLSNLGGFPVQEAPASRMVTADLANVYYYGKDFGSKKQKINEEGELELTPYRGVGEPIMAAGGGLVDTDKNRENNVIDALDLIMGESSNSMSLDDLLNIVKGS
jgi:hypothetical protein